MNFYSCLFLVVFLSVLHSEFISNGVYWDFMLAQSAIVYTFC